MNDNSESYDAIIFDMDGVIINSEDHVEKFWLKKLKQYEIEIPESERKERFHGRPARPTVNDLFADLPEEEREEIIKECAEYDASVERYPMIPGAERFLQECSENGIRTGLVTSALPGKVDRMLAGLSYPSPFEVNITANLVKNGKPDPECYRLAAESMSVDPQRMIVFEDSANGVKAASGTGATVVGINEKHMSQALIEAGAISVQPDFQRVIIVPESDKISIYPSDEKGLSFLVSKGNETTAFIEST